jgi:hypothetical protein
MSSARSTISSSCSMIRKNISAAVAACCFKKTPNKRGSLRRKTSPTPTSLVERLSRRAESTIRVRPARDHQHAVSSCDGWRADAGIAGGVLVVARREHGQRVQSTTHHQHAVGLACRCRHRWWSACRGAQRCTQRGQRVQTAKHQQPLWADSCVIEIFLPPE